MKNYEQVPPAEDAAEPVPLLTLKGEDCGFQHQFSVGRLIRSILIPFMNFFLSAREKGSTGSTRHLSCFRRVPLYLCALRTGMDMTF